MLFILAAPSHGEMVCKITDGDTVRLCNGQRIRIWGIDAPELKQPYGYTARNYLSDLVLNKDIQLHCVSRHYKRKVCHVLLDDMDISSAMVSAGYAYDYRLYTKGRYEVEEQDARLTHKGLWQDNNPLAPWAYRSKRLNK